jgi:paraquat-inducible protein B
MAVEKSYARLGLFIVVSLVVVLATAVLLIQRLRSRESIAMVTYTKENVSGLNVSSPVRLRGVPVGQVTDVRVDPKSNLIEIDFEVFHHRLTTIGVDVGSVRQRIAQFGGMLPKLRAQITGNPVTGEAYLLLDEPRKPSPPIELGFKPDRAYVPAMASTFSSMQDRLPELLDRADVTLATLSEIVSRIPQSLERSDRFFTNVERIMQQSELPALSADSRKFFTTTSGQMGQMKAEMDGLIGTQGTLVKFSQEARTALKAANLPAATQAARDAADDSRLAADDLRRSLPAIRESLQQIRDLARQIEEQPESVVYGPRPPQEKHQ